MDPNPILLLLKAVHLVIQLPAHRLLRLVNPLSLLLADPLLLLLADPLFVLLHGLLHQHHHLLSDIALLLQLLR